MPPAPLTAAPPAGIDVQPACEVLPRLWQSGLPEDWSDLRGRYDVVVDLADPGPGPSADDLGEVTWLKVPLEDGDQLPDRLLLDQLTTMVAALVRDGRRVLVHCTFGKNRSGLLMALLVRELLGCDGPTADGSRPLFRHAFFTRRPRGGTKAPSSSRRSGPSVSRCR